MSDYKKSDKKIRIYVADIKQLYVNSSIQDSVFIV